MTTDELQTIFDEQLTVMRQLAAVVNQMVEHQVEINQQMVAVLQAQKHQLLNN